MSITSFRFNFFLVFVFCILPEKINGEFKQQFYRKILKGGSLTSDHIKSNHSASSIFECGSFCLTEKCSGFNYKTRTKTSELNCQLTCLLTSSSLMSEDKLWDFYQVEDVSEYQYGTKEMPGESCHRILTKKCAADGIYWISLNSTASTAFPVFCDMKNGGWTLIFKGIAGVPGIMSNIWQNPSTFNENSLEALNIESSFKNHYKNRIVQEWSTFKPTQARIVLYSRGNEDVVLTFNTQNTNNINWFAEANLQTSPWQDIHEKVKNYFNVVGYCPTSAGCRDFFINHQHGGCPADIGWLSIGNIYQSCEWEAKHGVTSFLYSKKTTAVNWNFADVGTSEVFAVYVR